MQNLPTPPPHFSQRKKKILEQLGVPDAEYTDASPKGSVDAGIRDLIDDINALDGLVTTSSCAGRVSVFLEGRKAPEKVANNVEAATAEVSAEIEFAGTGGKGGGGKWLFVSHDPVEKDWETRKDIGSALLGLNEHESSGGDAAVLEQVGLSESRLIHFKFEPMILHILTASPDHAQLVLRCGLQAGFRESGALNLLATEKESATPMVAIRSMGLGFESLIGLETQGTRHCTVSTAYLHMLIRLANERFVENTKRIERFRSALMEAVEGSKKPKRGPEWEDAAARKERKRAEGLKRSAEMKQRQHQQELNETIESLSNT